ncbi:hypothetical protein SDC9_199189 [bioreactor metagenome]|uniref:Uncharacterized protein n=1 Tax=bioreactor metagenome TaxID=1076179 RepID=A0A645IJS5_9ZZZZ
MHRCNKCNDPLVIAAGNTHQFFDRHAFDLNMLLARIAEDFHDPGFAVRSGRNEDVVDGRFFSNGFPDGVYAENKIGFFHIIASRYQQRETSCLCKPARAAGCNRCRRKYFSLC